MPRGKIISVKTGKNEASTASTEQNKSVKPDVSGQKEDSKKVKKS